MEKKNTLKKVLPTLLILTIFLALALINTYLLKPERGEQVVEEKNKVSFLALPKEKIDRIIILNRKEKIALQRKGHWQVKKSRWLPANDTAIASLLDTASNWKAIRHLGNVPLAPYQLDHPDRTIAFYHGDRLLAKVAVGARTPTGDYYLRRFPGNEVSVGFSYQADAFFKKPDDFRQGQIFAFPEEKVSEFLIEHQGSYRYRRDKKKKWALVAPFAKKSSKIQDQCNLLMTTLSAVVAISFADDNGENLKKYGLDKPSYRVTVTLDTKHSQTLLLGKETKDRNLYAKTTSDPAVVVLGSFVKDRLDGVLKASVPQPSAKKEATSAKK